jgi:hypothetical protein
VYHLISYGLITMHDALLLAVKQAIDRDGPIYKSALAKHSDKEERSRDLNISIELAQHIAPAVMKEPPLKSAKNLMIRFGDAGGAMSFTHSGVGLLLAWANQLGPKKAVQRFRKLLAMKEAPGFHVEAFAGMEIKSRIRLAHNVELVPFDLLPNSFQKNQLVNRRFEHMQFGFLQGPSAALLIKTNVKPLFHEENSWKPEIENLSFRHDVLNATRLCLEVVGRRALVRLNGWFQYKSELVNHASGAGGASYPSAPYRANFNIPPVEQFNGKKAAMLTKMFFALPNTTREIVTRAMERLDKAMCDPLPGDAAIDLSIALEVLTTDPGGQGEHTWKVGLRSALLLGGSVEIQQKTRQTVKDIYEYRSRTVHDGHIPANRLGAATTAVKDSISVCAQIIERIVRRGRLPQDWSKFELSRGKAY